MKDTKKLNETTRARALRVYEAMGDIPEAYVASAEDALRRAASEGYRPYSAAGPLRRFLGSGLGVAILSGIAALVTLVLLIRAGQGPAVSTPPVDPPQNVDPPVGSIPIGKEQANFTIATERPTYEVGVDRIAVEVTGLHPGETVTSPGGWYLERVTDGAAHGVQNCYYTEEFVIADAEPNEYASFKKTIFVDGGLESGTYRLHATRHNGEAYESVARCEFFVGYPETDGEEDPSAEAQVLEGYTIAGDRLGDPVAIYLMEDGRFEFDFALSHDSSYLNPVGTWEERNGRLYLRSALETNVWVFERVGEHLIFRADLSIESDHHRIPDKQMFYRQGVSVEELDPIPNLRAARESPLTIEEIKLTSSEYERLRGIEICIRATEPNKVLTVPEHTYHIVKLGGDPNPPEAEWSLSSTSIGVLDPTNGIYVGTDAYAAFGRIISFRPPEKWSAGFYRVYILDAEGAYMDYCDFALTEYRYRKPSTNTPPSEDPSPTTEPVYHDNQPT